MIQCIFYTIRQSVRASCPSSALYVNFSPLEKAATDSISASSCWQRSRFEAATGYQSLQVCYSVESLYSDNSINAEARGTNLGNPAELELEILRLYVL